MKHSLQNTAIRGLAGILCVLVMSMPVFPADFFEVPAGTRFLVELRDTLKAKKIKRGKKFEARTLEPLRANAGTLIPAGAKLKGSVTFVEDNKMYLRFERIESSRGRWPIVASVVQIRDEKDVRSKTSEEGEIESKSHRGKSAAVGAAVVGGIGAAVGAQQGGAKGAAIGAGTGAAVGALIGAAAGGQDLILYKGTRLELQLERPLILDSSRY